MERLTTRAHRSRLLEWALILIVVGVLMGTLLAAYRDLEGTALDRLARLEHRVLSQQIEIYRLRHGHWPPTLRQLVRQRGGNLPTFGGDLTRRTQRWDGQGRLLDPYGEPYRYSPDTGEVVRPDSED